MRRSALFVVPAAVLGLVLMSIPLIPAQAQDASGGWMPKLTWPDGRELQWRKASAPACDGSDVELRLLNKTSTGGEANLSGITFQCTRQGEANGPARSISVAANATAVSEAIPCACAERGGVRDLLKVDLAFNLSGSGTETATNGCTYTGNFAGGQRSGQGVYSCPTGYRYEGMFLLGQPNGNGIETMGAQRYQGQFVNSKRQGRGVMTYSDGSTYDGEFKDGLRDGSGTAKFRDGSEYIGQWKADLRSGNGAYVAPQQVWTFDGEWVNDQRNGPGKISYADGSQIFEGTFRNGLREGQGTVLFGDGRKFVGAFVADNQQGRGVMTYADGRKIEGEFRNFVPHGTAVETGPTGTLEGQWVNGVLEGKATIVYVTGERFDGTFSGGRRNGPGVETRKDGSKDECNWVNDLRQGQCNKITADGKRIEFRSPTPSTRPRN